MLGLDQMKPGVRYANPRRDEEKTLLTAQEPQPNLYRSYPHGGEHPHVLLRSFQPGAILISWHEALYPVGGTEEADSLSRGWVAWVREITETGEEWTFACFEAQEIRETAEGIALRRYRLREGGYLHDNHANPPLFFESFAVWQQHVQEHAAKRTPDSQKESDQ